MSTTTLGKTEEKLKSIFENLHSFNIEGDKDRGDGDKNCEIETTLHCENEKTAAVTSESKITPISIGVISDPPSLILSYEIISNEIKIKQRMRKMPLRNFTDRSNVIKFAFGLRQRHEEVLADVPPVVVEKMLRVIQELQKGLTVDTAVATVNQEYEINSDEDLNKLSTKELTRRKSIMEETFIKNQLKPEDPNFAYDKEVNFDSIVQSRKVESGWDDEFEDNSDDESNDTKQNDDQSRSKVYEIHDEDNAMFSSLLQEVSIMEDFQNIESEDKINFPELDFEEIGELPLERKSKHDTFLLKEFTYSLLNPEEGTESPLNLEVGTNRSQLNSEETIIPCELDLEKNDNQNLNIEEKIAFSKDPKDEFSNPNAEVVNSKIDEEVSNSGQDLGKIHISEQDGEKFNNSDQASETVNNSEVDLKNKNDNLEYTKEKEFDQCELISNNEIKTDAIEFDTKTLETLQKNPDIETCINSVSIEPTRKSIENDVETKISTEEKVNAEPSSEMLTQGKDKEDGNESNKDESLGIDSVEIDGAVLKIDDDDDEFW